MKTIVLATKLRRDLVKNWTQFLAVFIMAMLSVLVYAGMEGTWRGLQNSLDEFSSSNNLSSAWIGLSGADSGDVSRLQQLDGVDQVGSTSVAPCVLGGADRSTNVSVSTWDTGGLDQPFVIAGDPLDSERADGIWLYQKTADALGVKVGDRVDVTIESHETTEETVRGLVLAPDKMYFTGDSSLGAPQADLYGYAYVSEATLRGMLKGEEPSSVLLVGGDVDELRGAVYDMFGGRLTSYQDRSVRPYVSIAFSRVGQIRNLSVLFSGIFIILALLSMYTSVRRLVNVQARDIASLKALGYSNGLLRVHYASYGLVTGGLGALAGLLVTPLLSAFLLGTQKSMFALPRWSIDYSWITIGIVLLVLSVCIVAAVLASRQALRFLPAEGLRSVGGVAAGTPHLYKRATRRMDVGSRWALRDALGVPSRLAMGVVAALGSMMLLVAGFGMPDSMNSQVGSVYGEEFTYAVRAAVPGARDPMVRSSVEPVTTSPEWVMQGNFRSSPDDGHDRSLTVMDSGRYLNLADSDGNTIPLPDEGAVLSEDAARALDVSEGDMLGVRLSEMDEPVQVKVAALAHVSLPQGVFISRTAWERAGGKFLPNTVFAGSEGDLAGLNAQPNVSNVLTLNEQAQNARGVVDNLSSVFTVIKVFGVFLSVVVLYNLGALGFTERMRDYATLRVLGFNLPEIRLLAMRENVATTVLGWLLEIPVGLWFLHRYVSMFTTFNTAYFPSISTMSMVIASVTTLFCSLMTSALITGRVRRIDMVEALKGVE